VFVPYPYHRDLHQEANARPLVEAGAAVLAHDRLDAAANMASIGEPLAALVSDGRLRDEMENALRARPQVDAADALARGILGLGAAGRVSH
jgi:UDP-N-acetylglucosamine--N-acetylmuramyl-(pentapeptide) pyrophosphoryl-undecaprenol N-acetylglucosamine transferase